VIGERPVSNPHPYMVEVYVAVDGSEACLALNQLKAYCARNGVAKETGLELEFKRYEVYEEKIKRGIQTKRPAGIRQRGQGIREVALAAFLFYIFSRRKSAS